MIGPLCAILGVLGFSFKAVFVKLAYQAAPVDATTLLALRMLYAAPLFAAMAWWAGRRSEAMRLGARDWLALAGLGFIGYYLSSLLDFLGLQYITVSLERLILFLYPTIVVVLSAVFLGRPITRTAVGALVLCYLGIALAFWSDFGIARDWRATAIGGLLVFGSAFLYAIYLTCASGKIARMGSLRFVAWAMLVSTGFILVQFTLTRPLAALAVPRSVHLVSLGMAVFSTVLPTWLVAESIRRLGANTASLIGSLGPVFTMGLGALILDERIGTVQMIGAAFVLAGVALVTFKPRQRDGPGAARQPVESDSRR
jgi:drug/metabolite transporter (DMT)-like permease